MRGCACVCVLHIQFVKVRWAGVKKPGRTASVYANQFELASTYKRAHIHTYTHMHTLITHTPTHTCTMKHSVAVIFAIFA